MKAYVFGQDSQDQAHENFKFPEELLPRGNSLNAFILGHHIIWFQKDGTSVIVVGPVWDISDDI